MASKIILKKSSVAAKAPVAGDLEFGELAINYTDSKLYFKKADGSIDAFTSAAASAPVTSVGGNIGAVTDAQLLASIKNVDGAGSGLDADFLDGLNASAFYLASNPNGYTSNTGTVTSVGATAPLVSSGGNTPSISIPAANSTTNGYMSSAYAAKLDGIAAGATNVTNNNQLTNGAGYITSAALASYLPLTGGTLTGSLFGTTITATFESSNARFKFKAADAYSGSYAIIGLDWGGAVGTYKNLAVYDYVNGRSVVEFIGDTRAVNIFGTSIVSTNSWAKWVLETTGTTAKARQGSDANGLNFTSNALWNGAWVEDDTTKKKFAYIQHLGNGRHEFRTAAAGAGISWVTSLTIDDTAVNSSVALTQGGNQVLHAGNVSTYALPIAGGSLTTGASNNLFIGRNSTATNYNAISLNGNPADSSNMGLTGGGVGDNTLYINSPGSINVRTSSFGNSFFFSGGSFTAPGDVRAPIFYDSNDTGYYIDPSSYSRIRQLTLTQARVDSSKYPVGHYAPGEEVFAIDPTWTQDQLREYFNSNNVSWVADSTAPGGYAIQLTGAINVGGVYGSGFPYIPVETDDTFYMEVYIKNVTGSNTHYMGSMDFNHNFTNLGGNPGSFGYWVMSNTNPGTGWTKYSGYISGFGTAIGQFVSGTEYWTPQALFNYSGGGTSYISGWKVLKLTKGIVGRFPNSTVNTGEAWYGRANDRNRGTYTIQLGGNSASGRQFEVVDYAWSTVMFRVDSANFSESAGSSRAPIFYDSNDTGYYIDANSTATSLNLRGEIRNPSIWINDGDNSNGYNENIRLFNAPNGVSVIAFSASGVSGTPTTSILGYSDRMERRFQDGWQDRMYNGYVEAAGSYRAPIFYDSNDTGYYIDPNSISRTVAIAVENRVHITESRFLYMGGTATNENSWGSRDWTAGGNRYFNARGFTFNNDGYGSSYTVSIATNGDLSTTGRVIVGAGQASSWLEMRDTDESTRYLHNNSGTIGFVGSAGSWRFRVADDGNVVMGTYQDWLSNQIRSNIFYDHSDTGYYIDGNSTSSLYRVNINNNILFTNYGRGMIGTYASTVYQAVFAMGDSYKLPDNGSTTGNLYGLAWSHPNAGGTAGNLNTHGLLVLENGGFLAAISGSIRSRDDMRSPIFYDSNDTGYYVNPNSGSNLNDITSNQCYVNGWFRNNASGSGVYNQATGQHFYSDSGSYWNMGGGNINGQGIRFRDNNAGTVRGYLYYDQSNNIGFLNSGGNWRLRVVGDDYTLSEGSSMRAQLYYDSNNTGYYADLNSTTYLYYLQSATTVRADSDRRLKENITPITSALSLVRQLQGCRYTRNDLADKTKVYIGMIAQDVLPIVPEVVSGSEAGKYSLGYAELVPVLNEAVKELDEIVSKQAEMFEERLSKQAAIIAKLEERLSKLLDD